jgi:ribokinase
MDGASPQPRPAAEAPLICVVGSLNVDLVARVKRAPVAGETVRGLSLRRYAGGKGGNQACAAGRLAARDARVAIIGRVGADADGAWLRESLVRDGVDAGDVGEDPHLPTGTALITVDSEGGNQIVFVPGANEGLSPGVLSRHHPTLTSSRVLLLQLEIPLPTAHTAARMGREKHAVVILDPAPARPLPEALLGLCDYLTPNETELLTLLEAPPPPAGPLSLEDAEAAARQLLARGARNVVVKLGARGALLVTPGGCAHAPALPVTAVDSTAAGDAWNAAFAVALAGGRLVAQALRFANAAGALAVTTAGAQSSLPGREAVERLLLLGG